MSKLSTDYQHFWLVNTNLKLQCNFALFPQTTILHFNGAIITMCRKKKKNSNPTPNILQPCLS